MAVGHAVHLVANLQLPESIPRSTDTFFALQKMTEQFADVPELRDDKSSQHSTTDGEEADKLSLKDDKQPSQVQQQPREIKFEDNQLTLEAPPATTAPDTRYVMSGQPTGWAAMAETVRAYDEEKVQDTKEDIDTLLVFVRFIFSPRLVQ